jgi:hypothetical protein
MKINIFVKTRFVTSKNNSWMKPLALCKMCGIQLYYSFAPVEILHANSPNILLDLCSGLTSLDLVKLEQRYRPATLSGSISCSYCGRKAADKTKS